MCVCQCVAFLRVSGYEVGIDFQALIHGNRKTFGFIGNAFGYLLWCYCNWSSSKAQKVMSGTYVELTRAADGGTSCIIALCMHFTGNPAFHPVLQYLSSSLLEMKLFIANGPWASHMRCGVESHSVFRERLTQYWLWQVWAAIHIHCMPWPYVMHQQ